MSAIEIIGALLLLTSVVLFLLEVKAPGFGALGISGVVALAAGIFLLSGMSTALLPALIAVSIPVILLFGFLAFLAHRARTNKVVTGDVGMIGLEGRVESDLAPQGKIFVRGELWDAWSPVPIGRGESVRVVGVRGLRLEVTAIRPERLPALSGLFEDRDQNP